MIYFQRLLFSRIHPREAMVSAERADNAAMYEFGEGATIYGNVFVLGDVWWAPCPDWTRVHFGWICGGPEIDDGYPICRDSNLYPSCR